MEQQVRRYMPIALGMALAAWSFAPTIGVGQEPNDRQLQLQLQQQEQPQQAGQAEREQDRAASEEGATGEQREERGRFDRLRERLEQRRDDRSERRERNEERDTGEPSEEANRQAGQQGQASLGVAIAATEQGVSIVRVYPESAADRAGLQSGDRIVRIGEQPIRSIEQLVASLAERRPGDRVTLTVIRGGQEREVEATLQSRRESFAGRPQFGDSDIQFRFRQPFGPPWTGDDLGQHIRALESEIRRLSDEIRDLRMMLESRPDLTRERRDRPRDRLLQRGERAEGERRFGERLRSDDETSEDPDQPQRREDEPSQREGQSQPETSDSDL